MTNRFGFKDFLQIVLLGAVLVLGFLQMKQQDRDRTLQQDVLAKLAAIEKAVSRQQAPAGLLEKLSAIESQLASDFPAVNDLCRHVERYRGKMLRPLEALNERVPGEADGTGEREGDGPDTDKWCDEMRARR